MSCDNLTRWHLSCDSDSWKLALTFQQLGFGSFVELWCPKQIYPPGPLVQPVWLCILWYQHFVETYMKTHSGEKSNSWSFHHWLWNFCVQNKPTTFVVKPGLEAQAWHFLNLYSFTAGAPRVAHNITHWTHFCQLEYLVPSSSPFPAQIRALPLMNYDFNLLQLAPRV